MTDVVKVALIVAIPPFLLGVLNLVVIVMLRKTVNGQMSKLLKTTAVSSHAEGVLHEVDRLKDERGESH
jgi:hypothetical protein